MSHYTFSPSVSVDLHPRAPSPAPSLTPSVVSIDSILLDEYVLTPGSPIDRPKLQPLVYEPVNLPDRLKSPSDNDSPALSPVEDAVSMRHGMYFFEDGNVTFQVDNVLYCVHRYFFARDSTYFAARLVRLGAREHEALGTTISLGGVKRGDFEAFLSILYPAEFDEHDHSYEQWKGVLHLSTLWGFASIRRLALVYLKPPTPFDQLLLGRAYSVEHYIVPALSSLCERPEPLTLGEVRQMSPEDVVLVTTVRESIRGAVLEVLPSDIPTCVQVALSHLCGPHADDKALFHSLKATGNCVSAAKTDPDVQVKTVGPTLKGSEQYIEAGAPSDGSQVTSEAEVRDEVVADPESKVQGFSGGYAGAVIRAEADAEIDITKEAKANAEAARAEAETTRRIQVAAEAEANAESETKAAAATAKAERLAAEVKAEEVASERKKDLARAAAEEGETRMIGAEQRGREAEEQDGVGKAATALTYGTATAPGNPTRVSDGGWFNKIVSSIAIAHTISGTPQSDQFPANGNPSPDGGADLQAECQRTQTNHTLSQPPPAATTNVQTVGSPDQRASAPSSLISHAPGVIPSLPPNAQPLSSTSITSSTSPIPRELGEARAAEIHAQAAVDAEGNGSANKPTLSELDHLRTESVTSLTTYSSRPTPAEGGVASSASAAEVTKHGKKMNKKLAMQMKRQMQKQMQVLKGEESTPSLPPAPTTVQELERTQATPVNVAVWPEGYGS
ncbi:hypothetical protein BC834DRAFT_885888 [Gloeopeniophorella convolvens]|nr:hypothetical protein BC834DRAFT_885888 [Gloeopeniophorella convolvens]